MVASVPYVKAAEPHLLETYTPEVTKAYISSRIESVTLIVRDGLDDPLDDFTNVQQQLEQLSVIGRCHYQKTCSLIAQLFDQSATNYQEIIASASASIYDLKIQEGMSNTFYYKFNLIYILVIFMHYLLGCGFKYLKKKNCLKRMSHPHVFSLSYAHTT